MRITEGIHKLIQSVFNDKILDDMIDNGNETKVPSNDLNDNFFKKEFQTLWGYINHKYAYTVSFDSNELIKKAIDAIDTELICINAAIYNINFRTERYIISEVKLNPVIHSKVQSLVQLHSSILKPAR